MNTGLGKRKEREEGFLTRTESHPVKAFGINFFFFLRGVGRGKKKEKKSSAIE